MKGDSYVRRTAASPTSQPRAIQKARHRVPAGVQLRRTGCASRLDRTLGINPRPAAKHKGYAPTNRLPGGTTRTPLAPVQRSEATGHAVHAGRGTAFHRAGARLYK